MSNPTSESVRHSLAAALSPVLLNYLVVTADADHLIHSTVFNIVVAPKTLLSLTCALKSLRPWSLVHQGIH